MTEKNKKMKIFKLGKLKKISCLELVTTSLSNINEDRKLC